VDNSSDHPESGSISVMRQTEPLPPDIADRPFSVAEGRDAGITPGRMRSPDLRAPFRGVRESAAVEESTLTLVRALQTRLPARAAFSHATAATLLGLPLPPRFHVGLRIHVAVPPPGRAPRIKRVEGHQLALDDGDIVGCDGVPVVCACRTWAHLAPRLTVPELVALGDAIVDRRAPLGSMEEIRTAAESLAGRPGARAAREAADLIHDRSESPQESILRVALVRAGLPRLDVNQELYDGFGAFIARPDLRFPEYRMIVEYEGDHHRTDRRQWRRDLTRTARLQRSGETVLRIGADDLSSAPELVAQLLRRSGWTPDDSRRRSGGSEGTTAAQRRGAAEVRAQEALRGEYIRTGKSYLGMRKLHGLQ